MRRGGSNLSIIVNLFAGPGAGKSTIAAQVFSTLKWQDISCEIASEYAKDLVWEGRETTLRNQIYVFGKQLHRLSRLVDKVDVIICDSPLLLQLIYKPKDIGTSFDQLVLEIVAKYYNLNYFIRRQKAYDPRGRLQTEVEAKLLDEEVIKLLENYKVPYVSIEGTPQGAAQIVKDVLQHLAASSGPANL